MNEPKILVVGLAGVGNGTAALAAVFGSETFRAGGIRHERLEINSVGELFGAELRTATAQASPDLLVLDLGSCDLAQSAKLVQAARPAALPAPLMAVRDHLGDPGDIMELLQLGVAD